MERNYRHFSSMRLKRGEIREDGFIFWCYSKNCQGGEWWMSPSQFLECDSRAKLTNLKRKELLCSKLDGLTKLRRGLVNDSGFIFWGYNASAANGEIWLTDQKFKLRLEKKAELNRRWISKNPERMEKLKRDWDKRNPEKVKLIQIQQRHARRARRKTFLILKCVWAHLCHK